MAGTRVVVVVTDVSRIITALRSIGIDNIPGYFAAEVVKGARAQLPTISTQALAERMPRNGLVVVDVRGRTEFTEEHIRGAYNIPLGHLSQRLAELPHNRTIVTQCASGYRSHIAASLLRARGYQDVLSLDEGIACWSQALPVAQGVAENEHLLTRR